MSEKIIQITTDFWNVRGEFKILGVINIGTHTSLVRRTNGKFVLLDAYTLKGEVKGKVDALTNNGTEIEAIINLHPFHTVHVKKAHEQYPSAKLYGTQRHLDKFPDLPWQAERTESAEFADLYKDDFEFSVPQGTDFIPNNEMLHFSSVLAYHMESKTIHSDDTLMYMPLPGLFGVLKKPEVSFHMTLGKTLQPRPGAVKEFRLWVTQLAEKWNDAENLCAAHSSVCRSSENQSVSLANKILKALDKVSGTLMKHECKYG
jgi:hypothetical protein